MRTYALGLAAILGLAIPASADMAASRIQLAQAASDSGTQAGGNAANLDERSDVFSLGKLLAFMVSESANRKPTKSDRALRAMCEKASSRNPADRYESVSSIAEDVSRFLEGLPVTAYQENIWERTQRFYQRYQAAILLITAYLAMRALFILYSRH